MTKAPETIKGLLDAGIIDMVKEIAQKWKEGDRKAAYEKAVAIIIGIFSGKLDNLKADVEKTRQAKTQPTPSPDAAQPPTEQGKTENDAAPPETGPTSPSTDEATGQPPVDLTKFRQGDVFKSLSESFGNVEVDPKLIPLETAVSKARAGASGWTKESTDDWNYEKAGNTEEDLKKGLYRIESTVAPTGYTRSVSGKVPDTTAKKLTRIAMALLKDPRLPLFKGIAMKVDGVDVMMVKEIHMHPFSDAEKTKLEKMDKAIETLRSGIEN